MARTKDRTLTEVKKTRSKLAARLMKAKRKGRLHEEMRTLHDEAQQFLRQAQQRARAARRRKQA